MEIFTAILIFAILVAVIWRGQQDKSNGGFGGKPRDNKENLK